MTEDSYMKWKDGKKVLKAKDVIRFYETNPTIEQERLRSKIVMKALIFSVLDGIMMGVCIGALLWL